MTSLTVSDLTFAVLVEEGGERIDHDEELYPDLFEILLLFCEG